MALTSAERQREYKERQKRNKQKRTEIYLSEDAYLKVTGNAENKGLNLNDYLGELVTLGLRADNEIVTGNDDCSLQSQFNNLLESYSKLKTQLAAERTKNKQIGELNKQIEELKEELKITQRRLHLTIDHEIELEDKLRKQLNFDSVVN